VALVQHGNLSICDLDPAKRDAIDAELFRSPVTELCVRNNRKAPTDKQVVVHMWTDKPSHLSFADRYLAAGETRATDLHTLAIRVVAFEIRWRIPSSGSPMWATTGKINSAPGEFFPAFGIRWDEDDHYSVIYPD
jgi:hypothetical protein